MAGTVRDFGTWETERGHHRFENMLVEILVRHLFEAFQSFFFSATEYIHWKDIIRSGNKQAREDDFKNLVRNDYDPVLPGGSLFAVDEIPDRSLFFCFVIRDFRVMQHILCQLQHFPRTESEIAQAENIFSVADPADGFPDGFDFLHVNRVALNGGAFSNIQKETSTRNDE